MCNEISRMTPPPKEIFLFILGFWGFRVNDYKHSRRAQESGTTKYGKIREHIEIDSLVKCSLDSLHNADEHP